MMKSFILGVLVGAAAVVYLARKSSAVETVKPKPEGYLV